MKKNKIFMFFLILFIIQIVFVSHLNTIHSRYNLALENLKQEETYNNKILINDFVRNQQRLTLQSLKQTWMNSTSDKNDNLLILNSDNCPIYTNENGDKIAYDENIMYKEITYTNHCNIYSKNTNELLISNAQPSWNKQALDIKLELIGPIKCFGNNGGIIVYDSNSGEVFLDTTPTNRIYDGNYYSIFNDFKNEKCKNIESTQNDIQSYIKIKKDSDSIEDFVYQFDESNTLTNPNDFEKYPLGDYNRLFAEKMILPYESYGFNGQPMQLTVLLIAHEKDISASFADNENNIKVNLSNTIEMIDGSQIILFLSIIINMIYLLLITYLFKYNNNDK